MSADARQLWTELLRLESPWAVSRYETNAALKRYDVWVEFEVRRAGFGLSRRTSSPVEQASWRHVNFGDWQTHVHVTLPKGADLSRYGWAGDRDLPLSKGLSTQVFGLLRAGCSLQTVCDALNVPMSEVWRFRFFIDSGRWASEDQAMDATAPQSPKAAANGALPGADDPVWLSILEGRLQLEIRALGLKLLMTRLRSQLDVIVDPEVRQLKAGEFYRYFLKNRHLLAHELEQIKAA